MKKFLFKTLLFFIIIVLIDVAFGFACKYLNDHSRGGGTKSRYYVCKESNDDILIFGSSRAKHHYVPDVIEDSLKVTCYNTGEDGNGIILSYGLLKMISHRYSPKLIIYDVSMFDMYEDDNMKYLDLLKPYYSEPGIDSIFWAVSPKTRIMMYSNLYRYNTTCLSLLGNYIHPMNNYPKGYCALTKTMSYEPEIIELEPTKVDKLKIHYFEQFVKTAKNYNIALICCVSPSYKAPIDDSYYNPIKELCSQYQVPFLYYNAEPQISNKKDYFQDRGHLNDKGARFYTNIICRWIDNNIKQSWDN